MYNPETKVPIGSGAAPMTLDPITVSVQPPPPSYPSVSSPTPNAPPPPTGPYVPPSSYVQNAPIPGQTPAYAFHYNTPYIAPGCHAAQVHCAAQERQCRRVRRSRRIVGAVVIIFAVTFITLFFIGYGTAHGF